MCNIHPLCSPRSTPTWPFDVKPPTYESIGLIPTCEPQARTDHERQLIFICVNKGKHACVLRLKSERLNRLIVWIARWWIVDSALLEQRKACGCSPSEV